MIEKLQTINELIISKNNRNEKNIKKHLLIREILKDKNCFLKMDIEYAYAILRDLEFKEEELKDVYSQLLNI